MELALLDAVLLPEGRSGMDRTLVGSRHGWPPGSESDEGVPPVWQDHVPAVGAVVEPGAKWNLAVGLESHAPVALMEAVRVHYESPEGRRFVVDGATRLEIMADCELSLPD
jgi:hypothetical protein